MKERITAIVPAGGIGQRFSSTVRKPFAELLGRPLIIWTLETLQSMEEISEIIPVLKPEDMEYGVTLFEQHNLSRIRRIAPGGKERQDSVYSGLRLLDDRKGIVLIHDGVRPLVEAGAIRTALKGLQDCEGVVLGVRPKDTIKEGTVHSVTRTLKRDTLWAVQTPQIFFSAALMSAYEKAMDDSFYATDDAALVERCGGRIRISEGSYSNIKITTSEDIVIAEQILRMRQENR